MKNHARIVFDLFDIKSPYRREQTIPVNTDWLQRIRHYGDAKKLRIVLDTTEPYLSAFSAVRVENGLTIKVGRDVSASGKKKEIKPSAPDRKQAIKKTVPKLPELSAPVGKVEAPSGKEKPEIEDFVKTDIPDAMEIIGDRLDFRDTQPNPEKFTLQKTVEAALSANIGLKISEEDTKASLALKKQQKTYFYPTLGARYQYTRNDESPNIGGFITGSEDEFEFSTSLRQPLFTGFGLINQYKIASLGLDISKVSEKLKRQDVILDAKVAYYNLLKAQKLVAIAQQTVEQIRAQREIAKNFYQVGMTPLNAFLQAQVELANAKQELIIAQNNLETSITEFNTLLRRPINFPVELKDITTYVSFGHKLEYCQEVAKKNRLEIKIADLDIETAGKQLELTKKDYFPSIDLEGTYFRAGTDWNVDGGQGIFDPDGWYVSAIASWDFWQWGRTTFGVKEKLSRLNQAQHKREELMLQIRQQVKRAFLKNLETEINIVTIQKAIEQAKENYRINQEQFKEQVATSTDVLIAQTLLTSTMTNYYNALYDFKISKAALYRAMGQEVME